MQMKRLRGAWRYVNEPQFGTITLAMTPGREI